MKHAEDRNEKEGGGKGDCKTFTRTNRLGYPLRFTSLLVSGLLQSQLWLPFGYEEVVSTIDEAPEHAENIDGLLSSLMEQLWHDPGLDFARLEDEWSTYMGIPGWSS